MLEQTKTGLPKKERISFRVYDVSTLPNPLRTRNEDLPPMKEFPSPCSPETLVAWVEEHTSPEERETLGVDLDRGIAVGRLVVIASNLNRTVAVVNALGARVIITEQQAQKLSGRVKGEIRIFPFWALHKAYLANDFGKTTAAMKKNVLAYSLIDPVLIREATESFLFTPPTRRLQDLSPTPLNLGLMAILCEHWWFRKVKLEGERGNKVSIGTVRGVTTEILSCPTCAPYLSNTGLIIIWREEFPDWPLARFLLSTAAFTSGTTFEAYKSQVLPWRGHRKPQPWFGREQFRRDLMPPKGETGGFSQTKEELSRLLPRLQIVFDEQPKRPDIEALISSWKAEGVQWYKPRFVQGARFVIPLTQASHDS